MINAKPPVYYQYIKILVVRLFVCVCVCDGCGRGRNEIAGRVQKQHVRFSLLSQKWSRNGNGHIKSFLR